VAERTGSKPTGGYKMKNSFKKYLMLVLIVASLFVTTMCVSYAGVSSALPATINCQSEQCKGTPQKPDYGKTVKAQCESEGYTNIICSKCKEVWGTIDVVDPIGHKYAIKDYTLDESGEYYQRNLRCLREDCQYGMDPDDLKPEYDNDLNELRFCQVNFINNFVAVKFENPAFCSYTTLAAADEADAYATQTETTYVQYPTGDEVSYVYAEGVPYRMADKYYGGYTFKGWLTQAEIDEVYNRAYEGMPATTFTLRHDTNNILIKNRQYDSNYGIYVTPDADKTYHASLVSRAETSKPVVTAQTPAKYDLYAIFKVKTSVPHEVTFYNYDGTVLYETTVNHATQVAEFNGRYPERADNAEYRYSFLQWVLNNTTTPLSKNMNINAVYGKLEVMADYNAVAKTYNLKYFERDGKTPINVAIDNIAIVGDDPELTTPINGIAANKLVKEFYDLQYVYEPTGKWLIPSRGNYVVDLKHVTLPEGTLDAEQLGPDSYIAMVPQYQAYPRMYKLSVTIYYPDDKNYYYPEEIDVQVTSAEGKAVGWASLDHSEKFYDKESNTYKIVFDVPYSKNYTVAATSNGYKAVKDSEFYGGTTPENPDDDGPVTISMKMEKVEGSACNCLCHTFFKPVWVGILNLLNSLFKAELVCCDDMFANIGSELNYGPAGTK
jgi:hypothetical protein